MKQTCMAGVLLLLLFSCDLTGLHGYDEVAFPETVENLGSVNSPDDDYNSALTSVGDVASLVFSSKRGGRGDFNFVRELLNYQYERRNGKFSLDNRPYTGLDAVLKQAPVAWALAKANSPANELGPYIRSYEQDLIKQSNGYHYGEYLLLFASDRTGDLDTYLTHNYHANPTNTVKNTLPENDFADPVPIPFLNSTADDGYPTFDQGYKAIFFTSNRNGSFDIFRATLPDVAPTSLHQLPSLTNVAVERVPELSSTADDKCPFISGNRLVFTSNRSGGFGGYDLYYSIWDGIRWLAPVNFGPAINTASDEYRPILTGMEQFTNQLMIFSSNRPGGKGGFDLYRVGVPKVN